MAELYLAKVNGVGGFEKQVVIKRVLPQLAESEELFRMFLDEARIAATLQQPNVVRVYDSCQENSEYFMAMEYLDRACASHHHQHRRGFALRP
ncbi:MAG: protein kinase [Myxococcales bacterium]|nr:protein kinase [Myxococcales bacterium]